MITVRAVGLPGSERSATSVAEARRVAGEIARSHPERWVDAKYEDGTLVHLVEPRSAIEENEPIVAMPADDQDTLF